MKEQSFFKKAVGKVTAKIVTPIPNQEADKKRWAELQANQGWESALPWFYGSASKINVTLAIKVVDAMVNNWIDTILKVSQRSFYNDFVERDNHGLRDYMNDFDNLQQSLHYNFTMNIPSFYHIQTCLLNFKHKLIKLKSLGFSISTDEGKEENFPSWKTYINNMKNKKEQGNKTERYNYRKQVQEQAKDIYLQIIQLLHFIIKTINKDDFKKQLATLETLPGFNTTSKNFKIVEITHKGTQKTEAENIQALYDNSFIAVKFTSAFLPEATIKSYSFYRFIAEHFYNAACEFKKTHPLEDIKQEEKKKKTSFSIFDVLGLNEQVIKEIYFGKGEQQEANPGQALDVVKKQWNRLIRKFHTDKKAATHKDATELAKLLNTIKSVCRKEEAFQEYMRPNSQAGFEINDEINKFNNVNELVETIKSELKNSHEKEEQQSSVKGPGFGGADVD